MSGVSQQMYADDDIPAFEEQMQESQNVLLGDFNAPDFDQPQQQEDEYYPQDEEMMQFEPQQEPGTGASF